MNRQVVLIPLLLLFAASTALVSVFSAVNHTGICHEAFYAGSCGHRVSHLRLIFEGLQNAKNQSKPNVKKYHRLTIWLVGDSTLDNKLMVDPFMLRPALNDFDLVLRPPISTPDVEYFLNALIVESDRDMFALNCAVGTSNLAQRKGLSLLPQDKFVRDHIHAEDVLVVSISGHDAALEKSWLALVAILFTSREKIANRPLDSRPIQTLVTQFGSKLRAYIEKLVSKTKPSLLVVCMIYFSEIKNHIPNRTKQHAVIRQVYKHAVEENCVFKDITTAPLLLFNAIDGKESRRYKKNISPTQLGGEILSKAIWGVIKKHLWS